MITNAFPGLPGGIAGATATLGFYGQAPVARVTGAPSLPATTASTTTTPFGYATQAQADAISNAVNKLVLALSAAQGGDGLVP